MNHRSTDLIRSAELGLVLEARAAEALWLAAAEADDVEWWHGAMWRMRALRSDEVRRALEAGFELGTEVGFTAGWDAGWRNAR